MMINIAETNRTRSRYDKIAPFYNLLEIIIEKLQFQKWHGRLWKEIDGGDVLEIGVGTGKNMPYYPQGSEITGIDLSEKMLEQASRVASGAKNPPKAILQMDAQRLRFPDEHFDAVVGTFVFCSVPDPILGLQEALRVTKRGGRLLLIEHMLPDWKILAWLMNKLDGIIHWITGYHISRQTIDYIGKAGWKIDKVINLDMANIHRMVLASKE